MSKARFPFLTVSVFSPWGDRIQNVRNLASLPVVNILERVEPVFERVENLGPLPIGYVWDFVVYEKIPAIGQFDLC